MSNTVNTAFQNRNIYIIVGYINECIPYSLTLPANSSGTNFSALGNPTTIAFDSSTIAEFIESQILVAQEYEVEEVSHAMAITPFVITLDDGDTYEFNPSALVSRTGNVITVDQAGVTNWPGANANAEVVTIGFSSFSSCQCIPVELIQEYHQDNTVELLRIVRPDRTDTTTNEKEEVPFPLEFGTLGPFAGPCDVEEQVLDIDDLCCNNNLIGNTEITDNITAWFDAATDVDNLLNGGLPIAGVGGEVVEEILNPLGVGPSWDGQGPDGGATYTLDQQNGLPSLRFDGPGGPGTGPPMQIGDHYELVTGVPEGGAFQVFLLLKPDTSYTYLIGIDSATGISGLNTWQLQGDHIRYRPTTFNPLVDIFWGTNAEFLDGNVHLWTITYSGNVTNRMRVWFDGDLRLDFDMSAQAGGNPVSLISERIGIMRNAGDNGFAQGDVYEVLYMDSVLSDNNTALINAYLICKWGIDPSLAAGGAGDLSLAPPGSYSSPTPFVRLRLADGTYVYRNTSNGQEFILPPVPGLSICEADIVTVAPNYDVLSGIGSWDLPVGQVHSVSLSVITEGATGSITLTTNEGVFPLFEGQSLTFGVHGDDNSVNTPLTITTTDASDIVAINWVEEG